MTSHSFTNNPCCGFLSKKMGFLVSENPLKFRGVKMWWKNICKEDLFTGFVKLR